MFESTTGYQNKQSATPNLYCGQACRATKAIQMRQTHVNILADASVDIIGAGNKKVKGMYAQSNL